MESWKSNLAKKARTDNSQMAFEHIEKHLNKYENTYI